MTTPSYPTFHRCRGCGQRYTGAEWHALRLLGFQHIPSDSSAPLQLIELRNCRECDSTCGREVDLGVVLTGVQRIAEDASIRVAVVEALLAGVVDS